MRPYAKLGLLIVSAIVAGCATAIDESETAAKAAATLKASFRPAGQAGLDRLEQDETQRACSLAAGNGPSKEVAATIERANLAAFPTAPADWKPRFDQDETMKACSLHQNAPPKPVADAIATREKTRIEYPADGKLLGD